MLILDTLLLVAGMAREYLNAAPHGRETWKEGQEGNETVGCGV